MALALTRLEADEKANTCPVCGGDARVCQDPKNQRSYQVQFARCFKSRTVMTEMDKRRNDPHLKALAVSTEYTPPKTE